MVDKKRGTGTDYGQDKLNERAKNNETVIDEKSAFIEKNKKPLVVGGGLVILIAIGFMFMGGEKTPAEKAKKNASAPESYAVSSKGVVSDSTTSKTAENKTKPSEDKTNTPAVPLAVVNTAPDSENKAPNPPVTTSNDSSVISSKSQVKPAEKVAESNSLSEDERKLIGTSAASNDYTKNHDDVDADPGAVPAEKNADEQSDLPPSDVKAIANAVVNDPTVKPTEEAKKVINQDSAAHENYDPAKFGITAQNTENQPTSTAIKPIPQSAKAVGQAPINNVNSTQNSDDDSDESDHVTPPAPTTGMNPDGSIINFTGNSREVEYHIQDQNTVYLYDEFSAKVYLLPLGKGEKVNAYLSDKAGWQVSLLPGNIVRINRAVNHSNWSPATDLFLVAGNRTYTLILQAVNRPELRTDSLRYTAPATAKAAKPSHKR